MEDRVTASLLLHALGDTIGYKNGDWEFNKNIRTVNELFCFELLSDFIDLGGINCIDLKDWRVSDDTVLHLAVGEALVESKKTDQFLSNLRKRFVNSLEDMKTRHPGISSYNKISYLKKNRSEDDVFFSFDEKSGGSGASMRTAVIGLRFSKPEDLDKLIETSIQSSIITHNHPTGYLGGLATALFASYAINDVPVEKWGFDMLEVVESDRLTKFMKTRVSQYFDSFEKYKHSFIGNWKAYLNDRFNRDRTLRQSITNVAERARYFLDNFASPDRFIGSSGDDSTIIAYDCVIDSKKCFEKLIVYSALHIGDTDTTACIACALYGAKYGLKGVPDHLLKHLEYKHRIQKLGATLNKLNNSID